MANLMQGREPLLLAARARARVYLQPVPGVVKILARISLGNWQLQRHARQQR